MKHNEWIVPDPNDITDLFNTFFIGDSKYIANDIKMNRNETISTGSLLEKKNKQNVLYNLTKVEFLELILTRLKSNHSFDYDGIPVFHLKAIIFYN